LIDNCDIIVSNPPYIQKEELETLDQEIRTYEPENSLTDYGDGTVFYEKILSLTEEGLNCKFIFLELSGTQSERIINLTNRFSFTKINIYPDLNKINRVLEIKI